MANVQTRRSISFALADFEEAQALAISMGIPLAQLAAQALREFLVRNRPLPPPPDLQPELDKRVGVLPREPFTVADARRIVAEVSKPGYRSPPPDPADPVDQLIERSSVGAGLRNIKERGIDAELEDLEQEDPRFAGEVFTTPGDPDGDVVIQDWKIGDDGVTPVRRNDDRADHPDAGEVRVVYDEEM